MKPGKAKSDLLPGTLDMLVLRTLRTGPSHGYAIAKRIRQTTADVLRVEEGSLYPALHRMERRGWIAAEWATSESKRRTKVYRLTDAGREHLSAAAEQWRRTSEAIERVLSGHPDGEPEGA